jgi:cytochrome c oxidase subunit 2
VRLVLTTEDAIHSFFVPDFRIKQDAVPGRYTSISFTPVELGSFDLRCAEYCGTDHAHMTGRVVVMRPAEFQGWLAQGTEGNTMAARGFALFREHGCSGCHDARSTVHAPDLAGLAGRQVRLQDGRTVLADDAYMRDSILLPQKDLVAGFAPVMPGFQGQLSEEDILDLIAYLKSMKKAGE